jgi:hypothetical protein
LPQARRALPRRRVNLLYGELVASQRGGNSVAYVPFDRFGRNSRYVVNAWNARKM